MPETELQGITRQPDSGTPNRKKTERNTLLSCKNKHCLSTDPTEISDPSGFSTDDYAIV